MMTGEVGESHRERQWNKVLEGKRGIAAEFSVAAMVLQHLVQKLDSGFRTSSRRLEAAGERRGKQRPAQLLPRVICGLTPRASVEQTCNDFNTKNGILQNGRRRAGATWRPWDARRSGLRTRTRGGASDRRGEGKRR